MRPIIHGLSPCVHPYRGQRIVMADLKGCPWDSHASGLSPCDRPYRGQRIVMADLKGCPSVP